MGSLIWILKVTPFDVQNQPNFIIFWALVKRSFFLSIEIWLVQVSNVFNFLFRQLLWLLLTNIEYSIITNNNLILNFLFKLFLQANLAGSSLKKVQPEHRRLWPKQWLLIVFIITVNISPKVTDFQILFEFLSLF